MGGGEGLEEGLGACSPGINLKIRSSDSYYDYVVSKNIHRSTENFLCIANSSGQEALPLHPDKTTCKFDLAFFLYEPLTEGCSLAHTLAHSRRSVRFAYLSVRV